MSIYMHKMQKRLMALTAGDLMKSDLVKFHEDTPLRDAARALLKHQIGGAPVVDAQGRCIGVLSTFDLCRLADKGEGAGGQTLGHISESHAVDVEILPTETVRHFMTHYPVTTLPSTSIRTVARMMLDGRIHRIIIVDVDQKPMGVVSSSDMLAALAYTPEEPDE